MNLPTETNVWPSMLKRGDEVAVVTFSAPEAAQNPKQFERGLDALRALGLKPRVMPSALANRAQYLADDPQSLAGDFNEALADDSISAIIASGGGTNANRLLPLLDYAAARTNPKIILGMSNVSVLLNAITALSGLVTFHGPVVVWNFGANDGLTEPTSRSMHEVLFSDKKTIEIGEEFGDWNIVKHGRASGMSLGGNLWSIESLLGTPYEPIWKEGILFWEDIGKEPRRIDAMLTHFRVAGVFDVLSGMVVGELTSCEPTGPSLSIKKILEDATAGYDFPIMTGVRFGHTDDKASIPIGARCTIDTQARTISFERSN